MLCLSPPAALVSEEECGSYVIAMATEDKQPSSCRDSEHDAKSNNKSEEVPAGRPHGTIVYHDSYHKHQMDFDQGSDIIGRAVEPLPKQGQRFSHISCTY